MSVAFDTLKFAQALRDKGKLSPEQSEGISQAFSEATSDELATKSDLADLGAAIRADMSKLEASTRRDIREVELRMEAKIEGAKAEILKWMFGQTLLIIGVLMALLRFGH